MTRQSRNAKPNAAPSLTDRIAAPDPAPPWSILGTVITIAAAFFLLVLGTLMAESLLGTGIVPIYGWTIGGILIALMVWQTRARDRAALQLGAPATPIPLIMFIAFGVAVAIDVVGLALTREFTAVPELLLLTAPDIGIAAVVAAALLLIVVQPIGEELIFRGMAQPAFRAAFGGWVGWIVASITYGLFHFLAYTPASSFAGGTLTFAYVWYGLLTPVIAGLFFGVVRISTGSTRAAIAAHVAFGLFALVKYWLIVN